MTALAVCPAGGVAAADLVPLGAGVRLDWTANAVELDAKVVLRNGPLELIACSPQTREHESILVTHAKPTHVFHALGLVGLQPGSPVTYDEKEKKWRPPTGDRLRVSVRCREQGEFAPVRTWVVDSQSKESPGEIPWVFAGSKSLPDGRFLADLDGTVICLVDFASALITVGALHSADNSSLWLEANAAAIPPIGTPCTIRIEGESERIVARLDPDGGLNRGGAPTNAASLAKALAEPNNASATLIVVCEPQVSNARMRSLRRELIRAGVDPRRLSLRRRGQPRPDAP